MADHVHVTRDPDSSGAGAIIGIVLGVLLVLILLWFLWLRPTYFTVPAAQDTDVNIEQPQPTTPQPDEGDTNIVVPDQEGGSEDTTP